MQAKNSQTNFPVEELMGNLAQQEAQPRLGVLLTYIRADRAFSPAKSTADLALFCFC